MHSALYTGWIRHRRFKPRPHDFRYRLFMMYLDLDELPSVMAHSRWWSLERRNLASFRRRDYLGDSIQPLREAVLDRVEARTGRRPGGAVRLLTHLRYFGQVFNPVSFYYCFEGDRLEAVVAEITNTPWGERHAYVLPRGEADENGRHLRWRFDKAFHVSPFMDMARGYDWRFGLPGDRLGVHMRVEDDEALEFDASLSLRREPLNGAAMNRILWRFPALCTRVLLGIHIQALKLWLKRVPVYDHPAKRTMIHDRQQ